MCNISTRKKVTNKFYLKLFLRFKSAVRSGTEAILKLSHELIMLKKNSECEDLQNQKTHNLIQAYYNLGQA